MFEGIIFIIFLIIGGITALLVLFFFVIAAVRRSKRMLKIGLAIAIIPLSLYALIYWFYDIHIPKLNKQAEKVYAGTYVMISPNTSGNTNAGYTQPTRLILNTNNTFLIDKNKFISFHGQGTWRAGATEDGHFEFRDNKNSIIFWAEPSGGNKLGIGIEGLNTQTLEFVK
jgi:hypothetical protein